MNDLAATQARDVKDQFDNDMAASAHWLSLTGEDLKSAASLLLEEPELGLRAGDAVHIVVAHRSNCTLCTLDRVLGRACRTLGVEVVDLGLLSDV